MTLKVGFYRLQNEHFFKARNRILDTDVVNDVMCTS